MGTGHCYTHHSLRPHVYLTLSVSLHTVCDLTVYSPYQATPLTPGKVSSGYHHGHHHSCHRERSSHHQQLLGRQRHASATRSAATLQPPNTAHMPRFLLLYDLIGADPVVPVQCRTSLVNQTVGKYVFFPSSPPPFVRACAFTKYGLVHETSAAPGARAPVALHK